MEIYFIGGSPCSGKSTIAQALSQKYDLTCFKVDDHLDRYMALGAEDGKECCERIKNMSPEEIWMRDAQLQCDEELRIYEEIFEYIREDLNGLDGQKPVITEGAAYLPVLAKKIGIPADRYLSITPDREFQIFHYSQREWVPYVLEGCSDKARAFANWMERDALFATAVQQQCRECGYTSLVNNGSVPEDMWFRLVAIHFGLADPASF